MADNVFDQFDSTPPPQGQQGGMAPPEANKGPQNPFDQFDQVPGSAPTPEQQQMQQKAKSQSAFMDAVDGFNRQFGRMAEGQLQSMAEMTRSFSGLDNILQKHGVNVGGNNQLGQNIKAVHDINEAEYAAAQKRSPIATAIGGALGGVGTAVTTAAQGGGGLLTPAAGLAANMGKTGVLSGLTAGMEYADSGQERFDKAMLAGAAGAGTQGLLGLAGRGVSKLFQRPVQEAADEISAGLRPTLGQATGNETVQAAEQGLGSVPLAGTARGIGKAATNLEGQVDNTLSGMGVNVNTPSSDIAARLKQGFQDVYTDVTKKTNAAYDKALSIAKSDSIDIPLGNTNTVAKSALDDLNALAQEGISSGDLTKSPAGKLITDLAQAKTISAGNFENLRKLVSGNVGDLAKSSEGSALLPIMKKIRSGLDLDLDTTAKTTGGKFSEAIQEARGMYSQLKAPYKNDPFLKKIVKDGFDTDQILDQAVKNERPEFTKKLFTKLTPDGQDAFATGIIDKALKKGIEPKSEQFDVRRFSGALGQMGETLSAMPDKYAKPIIGLKKLLSRGDYLLKAADKGSSASIGALMGTGATAGYLLGGLGGVLTAAGGIKAISMMLTSPNISKALVKLAGGKISQASSDSTIKSILGNVINTISAAIPAAVGGEVAEGIE